MPSRAVVVALITWLALAACSADTEPTPEPTPPAGDAAACAQLDQVRAEAAAVEAELFALQNVPNRATSAPDAGLEGRRQSLLSRRTQLRTLEPTLVQRCGR